jgi:hypothetical protein
MKDLIRLAFEREREHSPEGAPSELCDSHRMGTFTCCVCGKSRSDEQRAEGGQSEICVYCVRRAGIN